MPVVYLPIASGACLQTPPAPVDDRASPDGGDATSICGNARVDVAYMSRFAVDPDDRGHAGVNLVAVVINSGAGLLDLAALEVIDARVDDDDSALSFAANGRDGAPMQPGEARGRLSDDGRAMVLAHVDETWSDPNEPELSGTLTTGRQSGELHGNVVLALGPHQVTLDLEFDLTTFRGSGAIPQDAARAASICADGT